MQSKKTIQSFLPRARGFLFIFAFLMGTLLAPQAHATFTDTVSASLTPIADTPIWGTSTATLTIRHGGFFTSADIVSVTLSDNTNFSFTADNCTGVKLKHGHQSCTMELSFMPMGAGGEYPLEITVTTDRHSPNTSLNVSATALAADLDPDTVEYSFPPTRVGETSDEETFTFTNHGNNVAAIGTVSLGGNNPDAFIITEDTCSDREIDYASRDLDGDHGGTTSCNVSVACRPETNGDFDAQIIIPYGHEQQSVINVDCEGTQNDVGVRKKPDVRTAIPGDTVTYTVTVFNRGEYPVNNISVQDILYGDFTITDLDFGDCAPAGDGDGDGDGPSCSCSVINGEIHCNLSSLDGDEAYTFTYSVTANSEGVLSNTVSVTADLDDPNPDNNSATVNIPVSSLTGNVSIEKSADADYLNPGEEVTIYLKVTNRSNTPVNSVLITDTTFGNFAWVSEPSSSCDHYRRNGDSFVCALTDLGLGRGDSVTISYTVKALTDGTISDLATVTGPFIDTNPLNNTASLNIPVVNRHGDLSIWKFAKPSSDKLIPGDYIDYVIKVYNHSNEWVPHVKVVDTITGDVTLIGDVWGCYQAEAYHWALVCKLGKIRPWGYKVFKFRVRVNRPETVTNFAWVYGGIRDTNPGNNLAVVHNSVSEKMADLSITKEAELSEDPLKVGGMVVYTLTVTNHSNVGVDDVRISDIFLGSAFNIDRVDVSACDDVDSNGNAFFCSIDYLEAYETVTIKIKITAEAAGVISNIAEVQGAAFDMDQTNNTASLSIPVAEQMGDLVVKKFAKYRDPVNPGDPVLYKVLVYNNSDVPVDNVRVTDILLGDYTLVSSNIRACRHHYRSGSTFVCNFGTLAPRGHAYFTYALTANMMGVLSNIATVEGEIVDIKPWNNTASVNVPIKDKVADLAIKKEVASTSADPLEVGDTVTFKVTVRNKGPETANYVVVEDTLLGKFEVQGPVPSECRALTHRGDTYYCRLGTLASGASKSFEFTVMVTGADTLSNIATVYSAAVDPDRTNNTASVNVMVNPNTGNLGIEKKCESLQDPILPGDEITCYIRVTNYSDVEVDAIITDLITGDFTLTSGVPNACRRYGFARNGDAFFCNLGPLAANGGSAIISYTVEGNSPGVISNIANVMGNIVDTDKTDDTVVVNIPVTAQRGNLKIKKTAEPSQDPLLPGDSVKYTISVENDSNRTVDHVFITDLLIGPWMFVDGQEPPEECLRTRHNGDAYFCKIGALEPYETKEIMYETKCTMPGTLTNVARVAGSVIDTNPTDSLVVVNVPCKPQTGDLSITKECVGQEDPLLPDDIIECKVTVTNNSGDSRRIEDIVIVDNVYGIFSPRSKRPKECKYFNRQGDTFLCGIGGLDDGDSLMITYQVSGDIPGVVSNTVYVSGNVDDTNPLNNVATTNTLVLAQENDLSITKEAKPSDDPLLPGGTIEYTITITNNSPEDIEMVTLTDVHIGQAEFPDPLPSGCELNGSTMTCAISSIAGEGGQAVIQYTMQTNPDAVGVETNVATVTSMLKDPDTTNNTASTNTVVSDQKGDISVTKKFTTGNTDNAVFPFSRVDYEITITNNSELEVKDCYIQDNIVGAYTFPEDNKGGLEACTQLNDTFTCSMGPIAPMSTLTLNYTLVAAALGTLTNNARVFCAVIDTDPNNNLTTVNAQVVPKPDVEPQPIEPIADNIEGGSGGLSIGGCSLQLATTGAGAQALLSLLGIVIAFGVVRRRRSK